MVLSEVWLNMEDCMSPDPRILKQFIFINTEVTLCLIILFLQFTFAYFITHHLDVLLVLLVQKHLGELFL